MKDVYEGGTAPTCECGIVLPPDVVFFGDPVKEYDRAEDVIAKSDLIIVAGTSLQVAPFNHLPNLATAANIPIVYINGEMPKISQTLIMYFKEISQKYASS